MICSFKSDEFHLPLVISPEDNEAPQPSRETSVKMVKFGLRSTWDTAVKSCKDMEDHQESSQMTSLFRDQMESQSLFTWIAFRIESWNFL